MHAPLHHYALSLAYHHVAHIRPTPPTTTNDPTTDESTSSHHSPMSIRANIHHTPSTQCWRTMPHLALSTTARTYVRVSTVDTRVDVRALTAAVV